MDSENIDHANITDSMAIAFSSPVHKMTVCRLSPHHTERQTFASISEGNERCTVLSSRFVKGGGSQPSWWAGTEPMPHPQGRSCIGCRKAAKLTC